jgi:hypothetical protein
MKKFTQYPRTKVHILFTLAPMIGGGLFGLMAFTASNLEFLKNNLILFFKFLLTPMFGAELLFFIPAFIFSLVYVKLKLTRVFSSFVKIIFIVYGGFLIVSLPLFLYDYYSYRYNYDSMIQGLGFVFTMATFAVVSSLIMAWFALPKPEDLEDE